MKSRSPSFPDRDPIGKPQENRRNFFRAQGAVYLHYEPLLEKKSPEPSSDLPDVLDPIAIRLTHIKKRMEYELPPERDYIIQILDSLHEINEYVQERKKLKLQRKKTVILSGAGVEFWNEKGIKTGEQVLMTLSFLDYPFKTIVIPATAIECIPVKDRGKSGYRLTFSFDQILEVQRDIIIQFVNHLERQGRKRQNESPSSGS